MSKIYVDLDDVLCQTARAFLALLRREFGQQLELEAITSFDLGRSFGLEPEELERFLVLAHAPEILGAMEPVEGAVEALGKWVRAGYEVAVVTGRPPSTQAVSRDWLRGAGVPHHSLTFVDKYGRPAPPGPGPAPISLSRLAAMDFCLVIEDSAEVAAFLAASSTSPVALLDRPWNRGADDQLQGIVRCRDWREVVERYPLP